jgi:hypothetical protein
MNATLLLPAPPRFSEGTELHIPPDGAAKRYKREMPHNPS